MNSSITLRGTHPSRKYIVVSCSHAGNVLFVYANGARIGKFVFSWSLNPGDLKIVVSLRLHSMRNLWSPADTAHWTSVMLNFLSNGCVLAPRDITVSAIFATISVENMVHDLGAHIITRLFSDSLAILFRNPLSRLAGLTVLLNSAH